jgi:hypothetical protein
MIEFSALVGGKKTLVGPRYIDRFAFSTQDDNAGYRLFYE